MEALALIAMMGVGYVLTGNTFAASDHEDERKRQQAVTEGFGPSGPSATLDQYYQLPTPNPLDQPDLYPRGNQVADAASLALQQAYPTLPNISGVSMNPPGVEEPPVYNSGQPFVSPLSGLTMAASDFTHANMVPFFKGQPKQNMNDDAHRTFLDVKVGAGSTLIGKREQAPLFDPMRETMGNVTGLESMTDFMQERAIPSSNRAFERPVEPTRVGPGLNQGYSSQPTGGFQQYDVLEIARERGSIDELRAQSNPRITYEGQMIQGAPLIGQRGTIGEVRHYNPDRFFLNEGGERNFVGPTGENQRPTIRSSQVMKFQAREETSVENFVGPAVAVDASATYTTPSFRAPFTHQFEGPGFRNADATSTPNTNPDAPYNDFGVGSIHLAANNRSVTGERVQGLNLTGMAAAPGQLTVYDPNDVARTTVRETTGANDWIGAAVAVGAQKLTVYDPTDVARPTMRNLMGPVDTALNVTRAGVPGAPMLAPQDGYRTTSKQMITEAGGYMAPAGLATASREQVYDTAYAMRQNGIKELNARGRQPIAGNGSKPLFNGEDYVNMGSRRPLTDVLNERENSMNRVTSLAASTEAIGLQRPRDVLHMDVARDRNFTDVLSALDSNPYAIRVSGDSAALAGSPAFAGQHQAQPQQRPAMMSGKILGY